MAVDSVGIVKVAPCLRHGNGRTGELHLEHHVALQAEGELRADEVDLEHADEPRVVHGLDGGLVAAEVGAPVAERLRVMEAENLEVGHDQTAFLHRRDDFA